MMPELQVGAFYSKADYSARAISGTSHLPRECILGHNYYRPL